MGANNVTAAKPKVGGAVYRADSANPTFPENATDELTGFTSLGYISDDGITNSNSPSTTLIKAFGGDNVLSSQTDKPDTWKFKLIEVLDPNVLKAVYGDDNVDGTLADGLTVTANTKQLPERGMVLELILRDDAACRIVIPRAQIQSIGDVVFKDGEAVGYEVTYLAIPDSKGNTHYMFIKK